MKIYFKNSTSIPLKILVECQGRTTIPPGYEDIVKLDSIGIIIAEKEKER